MSNDELLQSLSDLIERYSKYRSFIEKASEQAEKFSQVVVDRVVEDNRQKMQELASEVAPMLEQARTVCGELQTEKDKIQADVSDSQLTLEELQLRAAIGELDDKAFSSQSSDVKSVVESADATITTLDEHLDKFGQLLAQWQEMDDDEVASSPVDAKADVADAAPSSPPEAEGPSSLGEVELEEPEGGALRGVLVVHEGTPHEQSLPIEGGRFTVGRGRNNDFQIKDDSKVSRRHTTFLDQGSKFLIRDGIEQDSGSWKTSANGTQVNGQLVTEATLVGGEEITIGETHFRFRVVN